MGRVKAHAKVAQTAFQMANSGKSPVMTIFWLKCHGWKDDGSGPAEKEPKKEFKYRVTRPGERISPEESNDDEG